MNDVNYSNYNNVKSKYFLVRKTKKFALKHPHPRYLKCHNGQQLIQNVKNKTGNFCSANFLLIILAKNQVFPQKAKLLVNFYGLLAIATW